jgi:hypothetical protein
VFAPLIDHDLYAENPCDFFQGLKRKIERRVKIAKELCDLEKKSHNNMGAKLTGVCAAYRS